MRKLFCIHSLGERGYVSANMFMYFRAQRANVAEQRAERLAQRLRELGIDPDKE